MWCLLSLLARAQDPQTVDPQTVDPQTVDPMVLDPSAPEDVPEPTMPGEFSAITPFDPSTLPWQIQNESLWARTDKNTTSIARIGGFLGLASGVAVFGGANSLYLAIDSGDDNLLAPATSLLVMGSIGAIVAPPMVLGASLRANRSLRERGVYVSSTPAVMGWTLYGLSALAAPFFVVAWPLAPAYYGVILACGFGQIEANRVGRRNAHLTIGVVPTKDGFAFAGRF